jgi:hypothetical protein
MFGLGIEEIVVIIVFVGIIVFFIINSKIQKY